MNPKEIVDIAKEVIPIKEAYCDVLQPGMKQLGKTTETIGLVINALLLPVRKYVFNLNAKQQQLEKDLVTRLAEIPPDNIVEQAPMHVVVPAIQAWSYSMDCDELRNLYANLLSNAMLVDKQSLVHPAFIEIIKQLNPIDAKMFVEIQQTSFHSTLVDVILMHFDSPYSDSSAYSVLFQNLIICKTSNEYQIIASSIINLNRLGLIHITSHGIIKDQLDRQPGFEKILSSVEKSYEPYENHEVVASYRKSFEGMGDVKLVYKSLGLTSFGKDFSKVCI